MNFRQISANFALIFCTIVLCWADQRIETQIGRFNLAGPPVTEPKFVSQFGQGFLKTDKIGDKILGQDHIYYASDEKVWVQIRFSHVLDENLERVMEAIIVTKEKLCDERFKPKELFGPLITSKGVKIGDSIDKIIETYGKPTISIDIGKDKIFSVLVEDLKFQEGRVLRYLTNQPYKLFFVEFYFSRKGLHSILISESE
jgi:hypothetical protein